MSNPTIKRRDFLKTAAGTAAIGLTPLGIAQAAPSDAVTIEEPSEEKGTGAFIDTLLGFA